MDNKNNIKKKEDEEFEDKMKRLKKMREKLSKNMGTSNYFLYLDANINSKASRGF